jgi:hypothetical protein
VWLELQKEKLQSTSPQGGNKRELVVFLKSPYLQQEHAENRGDKNNQGAEALNAYSGNQ